MAMAVGVGGHRRGRIALGIAALAALVAVLSQALLPSLAAKHLGDRVARYGTVKSVSVSAWPALELLWGRADSVDIHAGTLTASVPEVASMLWEAHEVNRMSVAVDASTLRAPSLPSGLTVDDVRMEKHGSAIQVSGRLTQQQLDEALPNGFRVEPLASGGGQVEAKVSGGFFGVQASIAALVKPLEGKLVAEPRGFPLAALATVTLFSDPHLKVRSVGVQVLSRRPLAYRLSMIANLL
jgi:hypothetical protein